MKQNAYSAIETGTTQKSIHSYHERQKRLLLAEIKNKILQKHFLLTSQDSRVDQFVLNHMYYDKNSLHPSKTTLLDIWQEIPDTSLLELDQHQQAAMEHYLSTKRVYSASLTEKGSSELEEQAKAIAEEFTKENFPGYVFFSPDLNDSDIEPEDHVVVTDKQLEDKSTRIILKTLFEKESSLTLLIDLVGSMGKSLLHLQFAQDDWDMGFIKNLALTNTKGTCTEIPKKFTLKEVESLYMSGFRNLQSIGCRFMANCTKLRKATLSGFKNITKIQKNFMEKCYDLIQIDLLGFKNVTSIDHHFFDWCCKLPQLDLSSFSNLSTVEGAFLYACEKLFRVDFSNFNLSAKIDNTYVFMWEYRKPNDQEKFLLQEIQNINKKITANKG